MHRRSRATLSKPNQTERSLLSYDIHAIQTYIVPITYCNMHLDCYTSCRWSGYGY